MCIYNSISNNKRRVSGAGSAVPGIQIKKESPSMRYRHCTRLEPSGVSAHISPFHLIRKTGEEEEEEEETGVGGEQRSQGCWH